MLSKAKKQSKTPSRLLNFDQSASPRTPSLISSSNSQVHEEDFLSILEEASSRYPSLIGKSIFFSHVTDVETESRGCKIWLSESSMLASNLAPGSIVSHVMEEKCGSAAICFISFLPDILDCKADGRNKYLEMMLAVAEKFKKSPYSYVWVAAGKQPDLENRVGVSYPALVALNVKKGVYTPLKNAYELEQIIEFVKEARRGFRWNPCDCEN